MRFAILCLGLLLTTPAAANSVEEALCGASQVSVPSMSHSEKLCRAFTLSLAELPSATAAEMGALLTPENLATMVAVTSVWLGTQGIPVVGQAVDAALLLFGATMVGIMSADIAKALWAFANQTIEARTEDDLKLAASSLAWAVSKTTVTIVAFVLTKKAFGKAPTTRPPPPPRGPALVTAEGTVVSEMGVATSRADVTAPAAAAVAVFSQTTGRPSGSRAQSFAPKKVDSKKFAAWSSKLPKRPASNKSPAGQYHV